jgi:hypothetical protein
MSHVYPIFNEIMPEFRNLCIAAEDSIYSPMIEGKQLDLTLLSTPQMLSQLLNSVAPIDNPPQLKSGLLPIRDAADQNSRPGTAISVNSPVDQAAIENERLITEEVRHD